MSFFHDHPSIPKGCNTSFFMVFLKIIDPNSVKDSRPFSLIGCHYNIIGKLFANRLIQMIGSVISLEWSTFVNGRKILDNYFLLNQVIAWCKTFLQRLNICKDNFHKAYDSIS